MNNIKRVTAGQRLKMALYLIGAMLLLSVSFVQPTNALTPDEQKACQARYDGKTLNDSEVSDEMFQKCLQRNGGNCTIESGGGGGDGGVLYSVSCTPPTGATTDDSNVNEAGTDTCRIDGIGWIICPVAAFLSQITDGAYALVEKLLVFRIAENAFDTNPATNPTFAIWSNIRNLANVAFVIAFFVVIFSQATSIGLSSYGVRKMLPRIIIAAILVNLSYYICAFAVDISNIVGAGIDGVIRNVPFGSGGGTPLPAEGDGKWEEITSGVMAGIAGRATLGALVTVGQAILFPFLAFSFLAILTAIVVLAARHALLIILIILSPLAFVAYILPNTEGLFDKWRKAIIAMLVMYPLIAILFSGSRVAGEILMMMYEGNGFMGFIMKIIALGVMAFPLFGVPYIVKFSGGLIGRIAGIVNDRGKGLVDRSRNFGKKHDEIVRANALAKMANMQKPGWGDRYKRNDKGEYELDKNGKRILNDDPSTKRRHRVLRWLGSRVGIGANYIGSYKKERAEKLETQAAEANRAQNQAFYATLNEEETDENGVMVPTERSRKLAESMSGIGKEAGVQRVRRRALEQKLKVSGEERANAALFQEVGGLWGKGEFFVFDENGKIVSNHQNTGFALAEVARGGRVGVIAAGKKAFNADGSINMAELKTFDGSDSSMQQASMEHIAKIGDGAAIDFVTHGGMEAGATKIVDGKAAGKITKEDAKTLAPRVRPVSDDDYDMLMQYIGSNAGGVANKVPHLIKSDNAFTGVNGSQISEWHGAEFKSFASRVVQLRENAARMQASGDKDGADATRAHADKIENAVIEAWNSFQNDSNLQSRRSDKVTGDFEMALRTIESGKDRVALREYGDATDEKTGEIIGAGTVTAGNANLKNKKIKIQYQDPEKGTGTYGAAYAASGASKEASSGTPTATLNPYANPAYGTGTAYDPLVIERQRQAASAQASQQPDGTLNVPHNQTGTATSVAPQPPKPTPPPSPSHGNPTTPPPNNGTNP